MAKYYILYNNTEVGPMTLEQLANYNITPQSMIRVDDGPWVDAFTRPEVMGIINQMPPKYNNTGGNIEKHLIAGVLAIVLGALGVQYFYIGKTTAGILTILLTILTCGIWEIISVIQGILMILMSEDEFERKYVYSTSTLPLF